ncbi:MAG: SDR family NAD(P)-dependent oxidoreductase [SAR324 cluster bacterium]|nr:SDR family NAD(P)-dependent oxidoreductase [SAR324 cluster bacterium]
MRVIRAWMDDLLNKTVIFGYDRIGYSVRKKLWSENERQVSMKDKVCLVTGANSGLGKVTSHHLAKLGATVFLICRNQNSGETTQRQIIQSTGNPNVFLEIVDMSEPRQIKEFAVRFRSYKTGLDRLINNAGVLLNQRQTNSEAIEMTFATNTMGYFLMTNLMIPHLLQSKGGRIVNVSSGGMYGAALQLADPLFKKRIYNGVKAYAESKRAEVVLSKIWANQLKEKIFVASMHPGWADTVGIQNSLPTFRKITHSILRTPEQGADTIIWLTVNPNLEMRESGLFWFDRKPRPTHRSSRTHHNLHEAQDLWKLCSELSQCNGTFPVIQNQSPI